MIRFTLRIAVLAGMMAATPAVAQQNVTLTVDQARVVAANAVAAGEFELALAIANGLLQRNPQDYGALMQAAAASIGLGQLDQARAFAKRAYRSAGTRAQKVSAARLMASAHFRAGQHSRAEIWLRRAFNNTPDEQLRNVLRREFALVRQENPFTASLSFSIAPNDNINNGSSSETVTIWNLPFVLSADARALSGIETSASVNLKYRLSRGEFQQTHVALTLYGRTYELSPAARAAAPGVKGSDYEFAMAEVALTHDRRFASWPGPTSFALTAGQFWYGGDPYIRYNRASVAQGFEISDRLGANLKFGFESQVSERAGGVVSEISSVGAGLTYALANSDRIGLDVLASETGSQDTTSENSALRVQLSYSLGRPVLGANLSFTLAGESRSYPISVYDPAGRLDETLSVGISMVFADVSFYGFSPTVTLEASRTESNISLFDRESAGIRFGIQSTF